MDGLLGGNWIGSGESIFYCLVQHLFAVFALRLIADLRYELLRFLLRFILRHFHCISNISAAVATLQHGDAVLHCLLYLLERSASIWRTRSGETPNSAAKSASVIGSSASRRA